MVPQSMDLPARRLRRILTPAGVLIAACALATACATPPPVPGLLDCAQLSKEIRVTEDGRRLAIEKREDPWKFVTPFAVSGVHVAAKSAVDDADHWLARLREEAARKRCADSRPDRGVRDVVAGQRLSGDRIPTVR